MAAIAYDETGEEWPSLGKCQAFTVEDFPDLSPHLVAVDFWQKPNKRKKFRHPADDAIVRLFRKSQPGACAAREFSDTCLKFWTTPKWGDVIFDFCRRVVSASILGIYDHCKRSAPFPLRYRIYRWLFYQEIDKQRFALWIERNASFTTKAFREHMFWTSKNIKPFDDFMKKAYYWRLLRQNTQVAMDGARACFEEHPYDFEAGLRAIEKKMEPFDKRLFTPFSNNSNTHPHQESHVCLQDQELDLR